MIRSINKIIISICIANYNGIEIIDSCISSIYNQTCDLSYEIIIHDDASTDGSADYINSKYPDVHLIQSTKNVGYCTSNNLMAKCAKGDYILFLNNDASLFPDALETLYSHSISINDAIFGLPQYNAYSKEFIDAGSNLDLFLNSIPNNLKDKPQPVGMLTGACLWVPTTIWHHIGGFPPIFESLAEDLYLCLKAHSLEYKVMAIQDSGYYHMIGESLGGGKIKNQSLETSIKRRALTERNKIYVMCTFYPKPLIIFILPIHILLLLSEGVILSIFKNKKAFDSIYLRAIKETWANRKYIISQQIALSNKTFRAILKHIHFIPYKLKALLKYGLPTLN